MAITTVAKFAAQLNRAASALIEQLKAAGVTKWSPDDPLTDSDQERLLEYLRSSHGSTSADREKISVIRQSAAGVDPADPSSRARTIQVEVRKKRVFVKRDEFAPAPESPRPAAPVIDDAVRARRAAEATAQAALIQRHMSTCCSHCGANFRVVQDQLSAAAGWVRCGRCGELFNAIDSLLTSGSADGSTGIHHGSTDAAAKSAPPASETAAMRARAEAAQRARHEQADREGEEWAQHWKELGERLAPYADVGASKPEVARTEAPAVRESQANAARAAHSSETAATRASAEAAQRARHEQADREGEEWAQQWQELGERQAPYADVGAARPQVARTQAPADRAGRASAAQAAHSGKEDPGQREPRRDLDDLPGSVAILGDLLQSLVRRDGALSQIVVSVYETTGPALYAIALRAMALEGGVWRYRVEAGISGQTQPIREDNLKRVLRRAGNRDSGRPHRFTMRWSPPRGNEVQSPAATPRPEGTNDASTANSPAARLGAALTRVAGAGEPVGPEAQRKAAEEQKRREVGDDEVVGKNRPERWGAVITTVAHFAAQLNKTTSGLMEQLEAAGVAKRSPDDVLAESDKEQLLEYLRSSHGSTPADRKKIALTRKNASEIKAQADPSGEARAIQVEVRKKRVFVKRDEVEPAPPATPATAVGSSANGNRTTRDAAAVHVRAEAADSRRWQDRRGRLRALLRTAFDIDRVEGPTKSDVESVLAELENVIDGFREDGDEHSATAAFECAYEHMRAFWLQPHQLDYDGEDGWHAAQRQLVDLALALGFGNQVGDDIVDTLDLIEADEIETSGAYGLRKVDTSYGRAHSEVLVGRGFGPFGGRRRYDHVYFEHEEKYDLSDIAFKATRGSGLWRQLLMRRFVELLDRLPVSVRDKRIRENSYRRALKICAGLISYYVGTLSIILKNPGESDLSDFDVDGVRNGLVALGHAQRTLLWHHGDFERRAGRLGRSYAAYLKALRSIREPVGLELRETPGIESRRPWAPVPSARAEVPDALGATLQRLMMTPGRHINGLIDTFRLALGRLGMVTMALGRPERAARFFLEAANVDRDGLRRGRPNVLARKSSLARALLGLASAHRALGSESEANGCLAEALELECLVLEQRRSPGSRQGLLKLAERRGQLAEHHLALKHFEAAHQSAAMHVEERRGLLERSPREPRLIRGLIRARCQLGVSHIGLDRRSDALVEFQACHALARQLLLSLIHI